MARGRQRDLTAVFGLGSSDVERVLRSRTNADDAQVAIFLEAWGRKEDRISAYADSLGCTPATAGSWLMLLGAAAVAGVEPVVSGEISASKAETIVRGGAAPEETPKSPDRDKGYEKSKKKAETLRSAHRLDKDQLIALVDRRIMEGEAEGASTKDFVQLVARKAALEGMDAPEVRVSVNIEKMLGDKGLEAIDDTLAERFKLLGRHMKSLPQLREAMQGLPAPEQEEEVVDEPQEVDEAEVAVDG